MKRRSVQLPTKHLSIYTVCRPSIATEAQVCPITYVLCLQNASCLAFVHKSSLADTRPRKQEFQKMESEQEHEN
ncbi:hypothetical protein HNY73_016921 [Argiope bruennichi]|uniref:Uncharacterized protein n=1 Tax=Argiope bruennichi TaxID=94029 RepID=A0A8T0ELS0_ARGBR|nr:hypothetical protein HNY73_016921 [Argiope bruennichi]